MSYDAHEVFGNMTILQQSKDESTTVEDSTIISLPSITPEMLPETIREWVANVCYRINTPIDIGACAALVILGNIIGSQIGIRPKVKDSWIEYPNLWGMIIGDPSLKKTPVYKNLTRSLWRVEDQAKEEFKIQKQLFAQAEDARNAKIQLIKKDQKLNDEAKAKAIQTLASESPPTEKRYISNDTTVEALSDICMVNPRGVLVSTDELSSWFNNQKKAGREGDRAFFLGAWNGGQPHRVDRIGRGSSYIESLTVGVFGNIQPDIIKKYVHGAVNGGADGLLQRFQLTVFAEALPPKWIDQKPNAHARDKFDKLIEFLSQDDFMDTCTDEYTQKLFYHFDEKAQALFEEWWFKKETAAQNEQNKALQAHIIKYDKLVSGMALIFHLVDIFDGNDVSSGVSYNSLQRAIEISNVLLAHAYRLYSTFEVEEQHKEDMADKVLKYLIGRTLPIKFRDISNGVKLNGKRPNKKEIQDAIKGLYQYSGSEITRKQFQ